MEPFEIFAAGYSAAAPARLATESNAAALPAPPSATFPNSLRFVACDGESLICVPQFLCGVGRSVLQRQLYCCSKRQKQRAEGSAEEGQGRPGIFFPLTQSPRRPTDPRVT